MIASIIILIVGFVFWRLIAAVVADDDKVRREIQSGAGSGRDRERSHGSADMAEGLREVAIKFADGMEMLDNQCERYEARGMFEEELDYLDKAIANGEAILLSIQLAHFPARYDMGRVESALTGILGALRHNRGICAETLDLKEAAKTLRDASENVFRSIPQLNLEVAVFKSQGEPEKAVRRIDAIITHAETICREISNCPFPASWEMGELQNRLHKLLDGLLSQRKFCIGETQPSGQRSGGAGSGQKAIPTEVAAALSTFGIPVESLVALDEKIVDSRFKVLIQVAHPDKQGGAEEWAKMLNEARRVLKDHLHTQPQPAC